MLLAKKFGYKVGYNPGLQQATTDHHPLSAASQPASSQPLLDQHILCLTYLPALEKTKLVEIRLEETKLAETKLATPPQLLPYVTPKPWPNPLPPYRPPQHRRQCPSPRRSVMRLATNLGYDSTLPTPGGRLRRKAEEETKLATPPQLRPYVTPIVTSAITSPKLSSALFSSPQLSSALLSSLRSLGLDRLWQTTMLYLP